MKQSPNKVVPFTVRMYYADEAKRLCVFIQKKIIQHRNFFIGIFRFDLERLINTVKYVEFLVCLVFFYHILRFEIFQAK